MDREKFVDLLIDIHLMDAITNSPEYFRKFDDIDSLDLYGPVFEKHGITQALFDSTVSAYTRQPEVFKEIYDEVLLKLNIRHDELMEKNQAKDAEKLKDLQVEAEDFQDQNQQ